MAILVLTSCEREKKLYDGSFFRTVITSNNKNYQVQFFLNVDDHEYIQLGDSTLQGYGQISIYEEKQSRYGTSSDGITYLITDLSSTGNDNCGYTFNAVCFKENLTTSTSKRGRSSTSKSYIGQVKPMSVSFDTQTLIYTLNIGSSEFCGSSDDIILSFTGNLDVNEARQASNSLLCKYLNKDIKLYPSKYVGDWIVEYEWLILSVIILIILLAFVTGDWWSILVIPIVTYISLYTSYMVCLPIMPFLLLIPLSYIPKISNNIVNCSVIGVFIGVYMLWLVYQGSTFWNVIVTGVIWCFGFSGLFIYLGAYVYNENHRCEDCGHRLHVNYLDKGYAIFGRNNAYDAIPRSNHVDCTTTLKIKPKKDSDKICFHCKFK